MDSVKGPQWLQVFPRTHFENGCSEQPWESLPLTLPWPPPHSAESFSLRCTSCLWKLSSDFSPWVHLEETSPPENVMAKRVPSLGREVEDRDFPFVTGDSLPLKAPDPGIIDFDFVTYQLHMCSNPRQKSGVICKRNHVGLFTLHVSHASDLRLTKYGEQYHPILQSMRKQLFCIHTVQYGGHKIHVVPEMQVALEMGLVCWAVAFLIVLN